MKRVSPGKTQPDQYKETSLKFRKPVMGLLILFVIKGLIHTSFFVYGETTFTDQTEEEEVIKRSLQCPSVENEFQKYVLNTMDGSLRGFEKSYDCLTREVISKRPDCVKLNEKNLSHLKAFRSSIHGLYQEMADKWVKEEAKNDGGYARNCLMTPKGIQLGRHIRRLRPVRAASLCQSVLIKWSHGLDQLTSEYLSGKRETKTLDREELEALRAFNQSPVKRLLPDVALYDQRLNDEQLKHHLAVTYNKMKFGTKKLMGKIEKFSDHEKYKLYEFKEQHRLFVETLEGDKKKEAGECMEKSHFARDCTLDISQHLSRCGSRLWGIGRELLPVIPLIDSISGMGEVMAAEASGVMTAREATEKRADLMAMAVFGGFLVSGGSILAKVVVKKIKNPVHSTRGKGIDYSRNDPALKMQEREGVDRFPKDRASKAGKEPVSSHGALKQELTESYRQEVKRLDEMGVRYRETYLDGFFLRTPEGYGYRMDQITAGLDPNHISFGRVLKINGAAGGKKHKRPLGPAFSHRDMEARIRELEARGIDVVVDTTLEKTRLGGYYDPFRQIVGIRADSPWHIVEHEFQHVLFRDYMSNNFRSMGEVVRIGVREGRSLSEIRRTFPDQVRKNWTQKEQNTIIRYLKDDLPENSLNERLSYDRQLSLLGWRRYTPYGQKLNNHGTRHLINDLDGYQSLTPRQLGIRNRASVVYRTRRAYYRGSQAMGKKLREGAKLGAEVVGITAAEIGLKEGLRGSVSNVRNNEDPVLKKLPREVQSVVNNAEEILFSDKGLLVKKPNSEVVFIPNNP